MKLEPAVLLCLSACSFFGCARYVTTANVHENRAELHVSTPQKITEIVVRGVGIRYRPCEIPGGYFEGSQIKKGPEETLSLIPLPVGTVPASTTWEVPLVPLDTTHFAISPKSNVRQLTEGHFYRISFLPVDAETPLFYVKDKQCHLIDEPLRNKILASGRIDFIYDFNEIGSRK